MRIINAAQTGVLPLGRLGENEASKIIFDVSAFLSEYPNAAIGLYNQRAGDGNAYPVANISVSGNTAEWLITNTELTKVGNGKCELVAIENNTVVKSKIYCTVVFDALDGSGSAPEPWDSWQDEFIELKAEAVQAAQDANEAASHYPRIVNKIWEVWDAVNGQYVSTGVVAEGENGTDGSDGADGFSPIITVTDISGGHRVSITDASGTNTFNVLNGEDGQNGTNGQDGYSPTVTITDITGGHRLTITDKNGTQTVDVLNGTNGTDGTDAYVYIRYSANEPTADSDMKTTPDAWMGIYSGDAASAPTAYTAYTWYKIKGETGASGGVSDVQVNGVSVLNQGVANVPLASTTDLGVVMMAGTSYGIGRMANGAIHIASASDAIVKAGTNDYRPIVPYHQHESAFYGFAKAAGDTSQASSNNAVGTYTENAKKAICTMLGVKYDAPFRLIYEQTITEETGNINILSDMANNPFSLSEILVLFDGMTGTGTSQGGIIVNLTSPGSNDAYLSMSSLYSATAQIRTAHIWIAGGRMFGEAGSANLTSAYTIVTMQSNKNASGWIACNDINQISIGSLNSHKFTAGTITIYGR